MMVPEQMGLGELGDQPWYKDAIDQAEKFVGDSGEAEAVKLFGNKPLPPDSELVQYVAAVGQDIVPQVRTSRKDFGYKFGVLDSEVVNAFALPNGSIYVTTGLLQRLRSEDELAALMGHEITHVTEHHGLQSIGLSLGSLGFLKFAGRLVKGSLNEEDTEVGVNLVHSLLNMGYSRDNEDESDRMGQELTHKSGYDAYGQVSLMEQFLALNETEPDNLSKLFMSHPWSGDRVAAAKERLVDLRYQPVLATKTPKNLAFRTATGKSVASLAQSYDDKDKNELTVPMILFGTSVGMLALVMYLRR